MKLSKIIALIIFLSIPFGCDSNSKLTDSDLIGTWHAIEMEGNELNESSEYQFILVFHSNHNSQTTRLKRGKKRESWGTWQIIQEEQGPKLYTVYNEGNNQKKLAYGIELKGDLLTIIDPEKLDRPYKGRTIWKRSN
jgi:hypothetical protein